MKLSELPGATTPREEWSLPYPCSKIADPPISEAEARAATTANCRRHHGLIAHSPTAEDTDGRVYFCGAGRQYWRYTKKPKHATLLPPLQYRWKGSPV